MFNDSDSRQGKALQARQVVALGISRKIAIALSKNDRSAGVPA